VGDEASSPITVMPDLIRHPRKLRSGAKPHHVRSASMDPGSPELDSGPG
jgi:hypothetical protein